MKLSTDNLMDFRCHSSGNNVSKTGLTQESTIKESFKLVYVYEGVCRAEIDGKYYTVEKGDSVLLFPFCSFSLSGNNCKYAWIEFSGFIATTILGRIAFTRKTPVLGKIDIDGFEDLFNIPPESDEPYSLYRLGACIVLLLSYYIEKFPSKSIETEGYVFRACRYIHTHFSEQGFGVKNVAEVLKIDRSHLYRMFKNEMGISVIEYITNCRLTRAELLLVNSSMSIKDVAYSVGFSDQMYFSRVFKQFSGKTPSEFRDALLPETANFPNGKQSRV